MRNHPNTASARPTATTGRSTPPRGDGVRGPIICFALGLALAIAGVSGGKSAAGAADAVAAQSATAGARDPVSVPADQEPAPAPPCISEPLPATPEIPLVETIECMKEKCTSGFTFFQMQLELKELQSSDREVLTIVAYELPGTNSKIAESLEGAREPKKMTLGCGGV